MARPGSRGGRRHAAFLGKVPWWRKRGLAGCECWGISVSCNSSGTGVPPREFLVWSNGREARATSRPYAPGRVSGRFFLLRSLTVPD